MLNIFKNKPASFTGEQLSASPFKTEEASFKPIGHRIIFLLMAAALGGICGAVTWLFFLIMDVGLVFFWETLPNHFNVPWYPVAVCTVGGLIIGLYRKKFGDYPQELEVVLETVKKEGRYRYDNAPAIAGAALLPLVFGGSIGPEAGLSGILAGLCTWVGERLKYAAKEVSQLAQIGVSATLSVIFRMPLFGCIAPEETTEGEVVIPKKAKMIIYLTAIFGGIGAYTLLTTLFGGGMTLGRFDGAAIGIKEALFFMPLTLIGILGGYLYHISGKIARLILRPFKDASILPAVLGGFLLGASGVLLPFTLFAGETQMVEVMEGWPSMSPGFLIVTGMVKLTIINICIQSGWKGGNIFPLIFSGVCIGYGMASVLGIDSVFAVAAVTAAICGGVMRKPVSVVLVLLLCFPLKGIVSMTAAAFIGAYAPLPAVFAHKPDSSH